MPRCMRAVPYCAQRQTTSSTQHASPRPRAQPGAASSCPRCSTQRAPRDRRAECSQKQQCDRDTRRRAWLPQARARLSGRRKPAPRRGHRAPRYSPLDERDTEHALGHEREVPSQDLRRRVQRLRSQG
eukprot:Amastigsp_a841103_273.p3 type:complete len:128 gc:universal Amastigsp_a841103_273:428-45(-)